MPLMQQTGSKTLQHRAKRVIVAAFLFMMIGTALELYLLDHYEDIKQLIPLLCIGTAVLVLCILFFRQTKPLTRIFKLVLAITALSGIYGTCLHVLANYEFEQEMKPTTGGWDLFLESLSGALPALAPASMIGFALLGYSYLIIIQQQK